MRLYLIMKDFIDTHDYCSIDYFVQKLNVSKRTIQNDISYLVLIGPKNGFTIHVKRGTGYLLEVVEENKLQAFLSSIQGQVVLSNKERIHSTVAYLSIQNEYITMDSIADYFQVSKTVIKNDMPEVEQLADLSNLVIERKSHYGIKIQQPSNSLYEYLVSQYIDKNEIICEDIDMTIKDFDDIEKSFIQLLNKEKITINYGELVKLMAHTKIVIYLSKRYSFLKENSTVLKEPVACEFIQTLESKYQVVISEEYSLLLSSIIDASVRKKVVDDEFLSKLDKEVRHFLSYIDRLYETNFLKDEDFIRLLEMHVSLLVDRLRSNISYSNALAKELSITQPMIFDIAIQFSDMLEECYQVKSTFDEIGFIATHFAAHMEREKQQKISIFNKIAVVCSSGGGSAYILKLQIESIFPRAQVTTFSFLEEVDLLEWNPDLIFTIMPLSKEIKIPTILINELLDDRDLFHIKEIVRTNDYPSEIVSGKKQTNYFSKDFFKKIYASDYITCITDMALELEEEGYGKPGFTKLVLDRESFVSTVYSGGVCIPHPIETDSNKSVISVAILDKPIMHMNREVKIIFMVCLKKEHVETYKKITKLLYILMQSPKYLQRVLKVKTLEEMLVIFSEIGGI